MDNLPVPNDLDFLTLLNDTFRDAATGDSFSASTSELYIEDLKDGCLARDTLLVDAREKVRDALPDVLYDLINDF